MKHKELFEDSEQPPLPENSGQTGIDIDRLETEAQTHDRRRDDKDNGSHGRNENRPVS